MQRANALGHLLIHEPAVLTIGKFDGIHIGHQALLRQSVAHARRQGLPCAVLTFDPHPATVINPDRTVRMLTTLEERLALIEALGPDLTIVVPFTRATMETSAEAYMQQIRATVRLCELWVGDNFALGRKREGTVGRLRELGLELGYGVTAVARTPLAGQPVSSSRVRDLLLAGEVADAALLLGRHYSASGTLHHSGPQATPLIQLDPIYELPAVGTYRARLSAGTQHWDTLAWNSDTARGCFALATLPADLAPNSRLRLAFIERDEAAQRAGPGTVAATMLQT